MSILIPLLAGATGFCLSRAWRASSTRRQKCAVGMIMVGVFLELLWKAVSS